MLSQTDADQCLEDAAAELKALSYEELEILGGLQDRCSSDLHRELRIAGETVYVNTTIGKLGWFRKRICVEMILSAEGGHQWPRIPCAYFERFKSGCLREFPARS